MSIISFENAWEMYRVKFIEDGKAAWDSFWALKDISFEVNQGEAVGIIGENGSGKSTILKLIAGMLHPDRGSVKVSGKVTGLLELGAGFEPELTGRENLYLIASLFGLSQGQVDEKYKEIIDFAGIGRFINAPVKCYSQGMFIRLAFAIAIHMDPEILLIDDTLAVGDEYFQRKCVKKIFDLKEKGMTIIFVTHDMGMLARLCKRAILLKDGRIVKDGAIDNVIPLYTQMIGTREGVGILGKESLKLIFNNGQLFLNWKDKLLTSNSGVYAVFCIGNKWHNSLQADWEVIRENENKLIAKGKFYQLAMAQVWKLELTDDCRIKWDIEIESESPLEIQEGCANITLSDEYGRWFTVLEKGEFPSIDENDKDWRPMLQENLFTRCIGTEAKDAGNAKIPSLAFEQSNSLFRNQAQIFNTGYLNHSRVLQYKIPALQNYSTSQAGCFNYFSGKISFNIPDIDSYLKDMQDEYALSNGRLKLVFDRGKARLFYDNKILTKNHHLRTLISAKGRDYLSDAAYWEVQKIGPNRLIAKGKWHNFSAMQIWEIEMISEESFLWKIKMGVKEETEIQEQQVQFMCLPEYKNWFSDYGRGSFPHDFLETDTDMLQQCISKGVVGIETGDGRFPALSLTFSKELNNFAKILNSDLGNSARMLQVRRVEPEENMKFLPGEYPYFAIQFILGKDKLNHPHDSYGVIEKEKLRFAFDKGRGAIYWDGVELTKRLGLHASVRSGGRWYDSVSSAVWNIEEKNKDMIKASSNWLHLPISQYWEIELKEGNLIEFRVRMSVAAEVEVDRLQLNLMLLERYSRWMTDKEKGDFPSFKGDIDDDWECVYSAGSNTKYIGVSKSDCSEMPLPEIKLLSEQIAPDWSLNVVNSDIYHRARLLQYRNAKKMRLLPGECHYCSGQISI